VTHTHPSNRDPFAQPFAVRVCHPATAWPLAERAEALLRAFNNPAPYAKRLARRLHTAPQRAAQLTRHPPNLPHIVDDFPLLAAEAEASRRRFESG